MHRGSGLTGIFIGHKVSQLGRDIDAPFCQGTEVLSRSVGLEVPVEDYADGERARLGTRTGGSSGLSRQGVYMVRPGRSFLYESEEDDEEEPEGIRGGESRSHGIAYQKFGRLVRGLVS